MRIALHGYGRMGREVEEIATEREHEITERFSSNDPVSSESLGDTEIIIDFSNASAMPDLVEVAAEAGVDLVTGTTGWDAESARSTVERSRIGFVHAPNFSPGAAILFAAAREAARLAASFGEFETGIHERHHAQKKDAPSGTALRLASEVRDSSGGKLDPEITAARTGREPGLHTLFLDGPNDLVELTHRARGRRGFATGAVIAAEMLRGRHGFFTFEELVNNETDD